ncbi:hypothetical protein [Sphingobacterium sp.]|uniref:hypothetical protein n=1 Tax=Sphingobacterium sp. TaxID=341027 RepID=UPI0028A83299|nr:hypothetical protein [Sphingobacterium sp.]
MGLPFKTSKFYKDFTHAVGYQNKSLSFRRKTFSPRLISNGGKMERMPLPCAMGLALECLFKIIHLDGMILKKIFPTTRHSFHVRMTVRKAILNEPKRFGYFCASKVTKIICVLKLLRRFGYFWASKAMKIIGVPELLRRFGYFCASKVT